MKNLTELKHYLTLPKAALRMVSLEWFMNGEWVNIKLKPELEEFRFVSKLQTNSVALATGPDNHESWLTFGRASEWAFDSSISVITNTTGGHRISYKYANLAIVEGTKEWERLTATA
jgi:hypothetical protein